jgi:phosphoglycolate phosphatase
MDSAPVLVLWDIDHTLIDAGAVGRIVYRYAVPAVTGKPLQRLPVFSGRTELDLMRESLHRNGVEPTDAAIRRLSRAIIEGHARMRPELVQGGRALPGAAATLAALSADDTVYQGLLTGNLREVARLKLEVYELDEYLDIEAGACGEDHADRARLVPRAQRRAARRFGVSFDNAHTVLIGDTPNDVRAALDAGVQVIGVATGYSDAERLRRAGARIVLPQLAPETTRRSIDLLVGRAR